MGRARITVVVRGRGSDEDSPETRGQDVLVQANGHFLRARSIKLECDGRKSIATLVVDVDEVVITDMRAKFNTFGCSVEHNADGTLSVHSEPPKET